MTSFQREVIFFGPAVGHKIAIYLGAPKLRKIERFQGRVWTKRRGGCHY